MLIAEKIFMGLLFLILAYIFSQILWNNSPILHIVDKNQDDPKLDEQNKIKML